MTLPSLRRMAHIFSVLFKHGIAYVFGSRLAKYPRFARGLQLGLTGPVRLRTVIEDLGGTFIKFGQMLALQPDVLPIEYCNTLFDLLDRIEPFPMEQVDETFIAECGRPPSAIFDSFEPKPIATASIGQVHIAYLAGRKLAVKVQRPSVQVDFAGDIRLMKAMIRVIRRLRLRMLYWMLEPTSEFVEWTTEELDYRHEARYMEQQRANTRRNPRERVPAVFWDYTSRRTLVVEFLEGVTVLDYLRALETGDEFTIARLKAVGFDPNQFVTNILDNFLGDAYRYGLFHADLHPANLVIMPGNDIGYIDFGITGVLSRYSRQNLVALTLNLGRGDLESMCAAFFKVSAVNGSSDVAGFRKGLKKLADGWYEVRGSERRLKTNTTIVMFDMLTLSRQTGIFPERDVVKYIRSAIAIDGLITRVAPGFDLCQHLEMISSHYLKWQARRALFSYDTLVDWSNSSGHLMRDGAFRAATFIKRVAAGELPARTEIDTGSRGTDDSLRLRAMLLGGILLVVSVLITATGERVQLGVNLFTAEAMLMVAAGLMFFQTIRGLGEG